MLTGLSTMWLFMYKMEWLFFKHKYFWIYFLYCMLLFFLTFVLDIDSKLFNTLKMPLISLIVFEVIVFSFESIYKRKPENTFWSFRKKPIPDIIFSILFWLLGIGLPFFLV